MNTSIQPLLKSDKRQALLRLLQLSSPSLPVGAYAYSQGLEWVVETGWIADVETLETWLDGLMKESLYSVDLPIIKRLYQAWRKTDIELLQYWNSVLIAYRETSELRKEELDKGHAFTKLLIGLGVTSAKYFRQKNMDSFLCAYCCASVAWDIDLKDAAEAYLWGWLENQVVSAMKIMPVGQLAGQKILNSLIKEIPQIVEKSFELNDDAIGMVLPAQAIASAKHETQYTRLFRS